MRISVSGIDDAVHPLSLLPHFPDLRQGRCRPRKLPNRRGEPIRQTRWLIPQLTFYLTSLLSLITATMLGFIDDLFDIRWRHKLPIPLIAAVPTLLVYYAEGGWTWVVLPESVGKLLRGLGLPGWEGAPVIDMRESSSSGVD